MWKDFVTAALLGTERSANPALPESLAPVAESIARLAREQQFLTQAGALALWRLAGWQPSSDDAPVAVAEPEELPLVSSVAASHLRAMLGGTYGRLLPEWLGEVARLGRRIPPEFLPRLLDLVTSDPALHQLAMRVGGRRAQWLASYKPEWAFAAAGDPALWETGTREQRMAILRSRRAASPQEARALMEATWKDEPAEVRTAFVKELGRNFSEEDIPFLESLLDDRSKEVRRESIGLLSRLPASPFVGRMIARATPLLTFKPGKLLSRASLEVTLPEAPDPAALRDGVNPKEAGSHPELGEKALALVLILAGVPLRHWTDTFQLAPAALLKAVAKSEFAAAVATGWALAAVRQQNAEWAEALLADKLPVVSSLIPEQMLFELLPESSRIERIRELLRTTEAQQGHPDTWQALHRQLRTLGPGHWPVALAREVLGALQAASAGSAQLWDLHQEFQLLPIHLPPALLPDAATGWPDDPRGLGDLLQTITFRHTALTALTES